MKFLCRLGLLLAALLLLAIVLVAATPQGRAAFKTVLFIPQIVPGISLRPQELILPEPIHQEVAYPIASGQGLADLYLPHGKGRHSSVLLFLGVNPAGRNDPRVVRLAKGLARSGMVVMIPWSEAMTQRRIDPDDVDNLVRAFKYLLGREEVDPGRAGMGGFCVGASLATVAAEDPRIRDDVRFVNFFGGYFDAFDLVKAISARASFYGGRSEPWEPAQLTLEVFTNQLIESLSDSRERELLNKVFLEGQTESKEAVETLSSEGNAVYTLLKGAPLDEAETLVGQLPPRAQDTLRLISPSTRLGDLKARLLIMQNREDDLIPVEESRRLADALANRGGVYYTEFSFFEHVDPTRRVGPLAFVRETFKLFLHMYQIMRYTT